MMIWIKGYQLVYQYIYGQTSPGGYGHCSQRSGLSGLRWLVKGVEVSMNGRQRYEGSKKQRETRDKANLDVMRIHKSQLSLNQKLSKMRPEVESGAVHAKVCQGKNCESEYRRESDGIRQLDIIASHPSLKRMSLRCYSGGWNDSENEVEICMPLCAKRRILQLEAQTAVF